MVCISVDTLALFAFGISLVVLARLITRNR